MNDIYTLAKVAIENGGYELGEKLRELTAVMLVGQISADEYDALVQLAYAHAGETESGNLLSALSKFNARITALEARVAALEEAESADPADEYPEWERWNGLPDSGYTFGAKVTHNGVRYINSYTGLNVWEPGAIGTESLWTKVD